MKILRFSKVYMKKDNYKIENEKYFLKIIHPPLNPSKWGERIDGISPPLSPSRWGGNNRWDHI